MMQAASDQELEVMNKMQKAALDYLRDHWDAGMAGSSDAATILGMNVNTLKTRINRNQALVMREQGGDAVKPLMVTGYNLIFNLIQDRMMRYGFSWDTEGKAAFQAHAHAVWVLENVLGGDHKVNAILRLNKHADGEETLHLFEDGDVTDFTSDAALIIPIGTMAVRIAFAMLMRSGDADLLQKLAQAD